MPIELWEMKLFDNDILIFNQVNPSNPSESIKQIKTNDKNIKTVSKEVISYDETFHLQKASEKTISLYKILKEEILNIGNIKCKFNKNYIAFIGSKKMLLMWSYKNKS